ncbi:hypothetical protein B0A49_07614, partial [Cryomyces minteri]
MSTAARRRLMRDFKVHTKPVSQAASPFHSWPIKNTADLAVVQRMQTDPPAGVSASPIADNVMT